jgi:hypothetical protein
MVDPFSSIRLWGPAGRPTRCGARPAVTYIHSVVPVTVEGVRPAMKDLMHDTAS